MQISCPICSDSFLPSDSININNCGHLFHCHCIVQWIERSRTCPQCRKRCCKETVFRVYFNFTQSSNTDADVSVLERKLESALSTCQSKESEAASAKQEIEQLKTEMKKSVVLIKAIEKKLKKSEFLVLTYIAQYATLKEKLDSMNGIESELNETKRQLKQLKSFEVIMNGSKDEADSMIAESNDPKLLCVLIGALKRDLKATQKQKTDLRKIISNYKIELRTESELNRQLENDLRSLRNESALSETTVPESPGNGDIGFINNLPDATPATSPSTSRSTSKIVVSAPGKAITLDPSDASPSEHPYLKIQKSNLGVTPFIRFLDAPKETRSLKRSASMLDIFQRSRIKLIKKNPSFVSNGVGGSDRVEHFPGFPDRQAAGSSQLLERSKNEKRKKNLRPLPDKES